MSSVRWMVSSSETQEVSARLSDAPEDSDSSASLRKRCEIAEEMTELYQRQLERITEENRKLRQRNRGFATERKRLHRLVRHLAAIVEAQSSVVFVPAVDKSDTESPESFSKVLASPKKQAFRLHMRYEKDTNTEKTRETPSKTVKGWNFKRKVKGGAVNVKLSWPRESDEEATKENISEQLHRGLQEVGSASLEVDDEGSFEMIQAYYE